MKFLIDENLSPALPDLIAQLGHRADHAGGAEGGGDPDPDLFRRAISYDALITADAFKDAATRPIAQQAMFQAIRVVYLKQPKSGGFPAAMQAAWIERHLAAMEREIRNPDGARAMSITDRGAMFSTDASTVRRWLSEHGYEPWPAGPAGLSRRLR